MSIRKWYEVSCDYCNSGIGHYRADTIKEVIEQVKKHEHGIVKYVVGKRQPYVFCHEMCYKIWEKENGREE